MSIRAVIILMHCLQAGTADEYLLAVTGRRVAKSDIGPLSILS
jgi:hypothetical protein